MIFRLVSLRIFIQLYDEILLQTVGTCSVGASVTREWTAIHHLCDTLAGETPRLQVC